MSDAEEAPIKTRDPLAIQVFKFYTTIYFNPLAWQEKFKRWLELKHDNVNFNERLLQNREFHNPNIAEKMLEFIGVNEFGSNLPLELYDPNYFPLNSDYEAIAATQLGQWERENKRPFTVGTNMMKPTIAAPYIQVPATLSKKHQVMLERFYTKK